MSTEGKSWKRTKGVLWTDEICEWIKERIPCREHGYTSRKQILDELNQTFKTSFTVRAFCTHCYEKGIQLGLCHSNSAISRGEKHWRHRPVGSFQEKKGYVRIKIGEPNHWMQYQRYIWEQNHPGESAEGKTVIFMDGNNRNFNPSNLECVERAELSIMSELGCNSNCTREEREVFLLRARLICEKSKIFGRKKTARLHNKLNYERRKNDPEVKAKRAEYAKRRMVAIMSDPVRHQEFLEKQRAYREKNRERINKWANERRARMKIEEPERYQEKLRKERERQRKLKEK